MSQKNLLPVRKGRAKKPSDAATLLHALVVALRDERPREDLIKLVSVYPRVMNRTNPFLQLIDEIGNLRDQLGFPHDQGELLRDVDGQLEAWTNHRKRSANNKQITLPDGTTAYIRVQEVEASTAEEALNQSDKRTQEVQYVPWSRPAQ